MMLLARKECSFQTANRPSDSNRQPADYAKLASPNTPQQPSSNSNKINEKRGLVLPGSSDFFIGLWHHLL